MIKLGLGILKYDLCTEKNKHVMHR